MRATASTSPFLTAFRRISRSGSWLEKQTWPIATATRWVTDLALVDMRWISDEGVRWGREDGAGFAGGAGDGGGGGVFGDVVEIARMVVVGWYMLDKRWNGTDRGVVDFRVVDVGGLLWVGTDAGRE